MCSTGGTCGSGKCPPPGNCTTGTGFPTFVKGCTNSDSCVIGYHQVDCCGTLIAIGINHSERDAFDAAEAAWEATCPACGCAAQPTKTEDGRTGTMANITVTCDSGMCITHAP
jgi:hypothetical protein